MTTIVVEELRTTLDQDFTTKLFPRLHLVAIRPYLYLHNNPAGTFTLSVYDSGSNLLESKSFTASDVYTALDTVNTYAHVWYNVEFTNPLNLPAGVYTMRLSASGYTFNNSSFIGWIREHENLKVPLDFTPTNDMFNPMAYELWSRN